jgi:hypothetical protein
MAITGKRITVVSYSGDLDFTEQFPAADNAASPGVIDLVNLANGFNSVAVKTAAKALTIVPPSGNATSITLKGVTGDTGIRIHNTDPTTIAIDSSVTTIGLTAGGAITGVRFIWT